MNAFLFWLFLVFASVVCFLNSKPGTPAHLTAKVIMLVMLFGPAALLPLLLTRTGKDLAL